MPTFNEEGRILNGTNCTRRDLVGSTFKDATLNNSVVDRARLGETNFEGAVWDGVSAVGASFFLDGVFGPANFTGASFSNVTLNVAKPQGAEMTGLTCFALTMRNADLTMASRAEANLTNASFRGAKLLETNVEGATLRNTDFTGADLTGAGFTSIRIFGAIFDMAILKGLSWTDTEPAGNASTTDLSFRGADLTDFSSEDSNFAWADFRNHPSGQATLMNNANFADSNLAGALMTGVEAVGSFFEDADPTGANLSGGNFAGANLTNADFSFATLDGADFTGADLTGTQF